MHSQEGEDRSSSKSTGYNTGSVFKCRRDKAQVRTHILQDRMKVGTALSSFSFSLQPIFVLKVMGLLPGAQRTPEKSVAVGQVREALILNGEKC